MLKFSGVWRFDSPGAVPSGVVNDVTGLIGKVATQGDRQTILEHFKGYFAKAAGTTSSWSSSAGWAETDLARYMDMAATNAPLFIEAFYDACETLREKEADFAVPDVRMINGVPAKYGADYEVRPPDLITGKFQVAPVAVPEKAPSLDEQAQELIQKSLSDAENLLVERRYRQAVQEVLWLLETVSTAFPGLATGSGTVQGKSTRF